MNPLSAIFGAGVAVRNALYDRGIFAVKKLARPVISVGNISAGGSGKTPLVIALGELLKGRGIECDVLSRGYGRCGTDTIIVDAQGTPRQFGDEPLLIARKLEVPVIVGADRYSAGLLAESTYKCKVHLLDDAFQHRRLHRDFDIVVLAGSDLSGTLLPAGRLREPVSSLNRADAVVSDSGESEAGEPESLASSRANSLNTAEKVTESEELHAPPLRVLPTDIWRIRRNVYLPAAPRKAVAFCGIARPHQFFGQLTELGLELTEIVAFPDHHRYSESDVSSLLLKKEKTGAEAFITTEKDLINLGKLAERLQPLEIAELRVVFEDPPQVLETLLETLERRCGCRF